MTRFQWKVVLWLSQYGFGNSALDGNELPNDVTESENEIAVVVKPFFSARPNGDQLGTGVWAPSQMISAGGSRGSRYDQKQLGIQVWSLNMILSCDPLLINKEWDKPRNNWRQIFWWSQPRNDDSVQETVWRSIPNFPRVSSFYLCQETPFSKLISSPNIKHPRSHGKWECLIWTENGINTRLCIHIYI